jgi:hypothetical protein
MLIKTTRKKQNPRFLFSHCKLQTRALKHRRFRSTVKGLDLLDFEFHLRAHLFLTLKTGDFIANIVLRILNARLPQQPINIFEN